MGLVAGWPGGRGSPPARPGEIQGDMDSEEVRVVGTGRAL